MRSLGQAVIVLLWCLTPWSARAAVQFQLPVETETSQAVAVGVAGSFNGWNARQTPLALEGTTWSAVVALPDGRHYYRFVWQDREDNVHPTNDPRNPFIADDDRRGAHNFVDVRDGARVELTGGLEKFEWPAPKIRVIVGRDGNTTFPVIQEQAGGSLPQLAPGNEKWVTVAGDFNDWRIRQFPLARCPDGTWRAWIPLRRPFTYKLATDGRWRYDRGNDPAPTVIYEPGGVARHEYPEVIYRVPDFYGAFRNHRAQSVMTSPGLVQANRPVVPGDWGVLDEISSHARSGDYGRAVALARRVETVNARAGGPSAPLVLQALALEGGIHRRWAQFDETARCWLSMLQADTDSTVTQRVAPELAGYFLHVRKDPAAARAVCERVMPRLGRGIVGVKTLCRYAAATLHEHRYEETLLTIETATRTMPPPDRTDQDYAEAVAGLWLVKGYCHFDLRQWDNARADFSHVAEILSPWPDSTSLHKARKWLGFVEQRRIDPYDL